MYREAIPYNGMATLPGMMPDFTQGFIKRDRGQSENNRNIKGKACQFLVAFPGPDINNLSPHEGLDLEC